MKQELTKDTIMEWDIVNWSRALPFWQSKSRLDLKNCNALEIGSRNGGLALWLSNICKKVTYSDLDKPTEECIKLHSKFKPTNIDYKIINAIQPIELPPHDIIVTKSITGAMAPENRKQMLQNIHNNLTETGEYWFVENLEGALIHKILRNKFVPWGNRWSYLKLEEIKDDFSMFREFEYRTIGFLGTFGRNSFQRNVLGYIDRLFFDKIVPKRMHYIIIGIARK